MLNELSLNFLTPIVNQSFVNQCDNLYCIKFASLFNFLNLFRVSFQRSDPTTAPQMFARFLSTVLDQSAPVALSSDGRSSSGQIFKAPSSVDDVAICTSTSSNSLNAISGSNGENSLSSSTGTGLLSAFKRVGSYSPARRQRKLDMKDGGSGKKSNKH